jgi:hypothetical protein
VVGAAIAPSPVAGGIEDATIHRDVEYSTAE